MKVSPLSILDVVAAVLWAVAGGRMVVSDYQPDEWLLWIIVFYAVVGLLNSAIEREAKVRR